MKCNECHSLLNKIEKASGRCSNCGAKICVDEYPAQKFTTKYGKLIAIEHPKGSERKWKTPEGKEGSTIMKNDYGRILNTKGNDEDQIDVFLASEEEPPFIFVVNQMTPDGRTFDEHKTIIGANTEDEARKTYLQNYQENWKGLGSIVKISPEKFLQWLNSASHTLPLDPLEVQMDSLFCVSCGYMMDFVPQEGSVCPCCKSSNIIGFVSPEVMINPETASDELIGKCVFDLRQSPPKGWPTSPAMYADPGNWGFRVDDAGHTKAAMAYYNAGAGKAQRSASLWKIIGRRIALAAKKFFGNAYYLAKGKIVNTKKSVISDECYCNTCESNIPGVDMCPMCGATDVVKNTDGIDVPGEGTIPTNEEPGETSQIISNDENVIELVYDEQDVEDTETTCEAEFEIVTDGVGLKKGELMRVRQLATVADKVNANKRLYPRDTVQDAISRPEGARDRARLGLMLSEYKHPKPAVVDGEEKFTDNEDRKTARVDDIEDVCSDGKVYVTRTILDTVLGRKIADLYRRGKHRGLSLRWKMRSIPQTIDGEKVNVAKHLAWSTVDDVDYPAFEETSQDYNIVAADSAAQIQEPYHGLPQRKAQMKPELKAAVDSLYETIAVAIGSRDRATFTDKLSSTYLAVQDEARLAMRDPEADKPEIARMLLRVDEDMKTVGYDKGRPSPTITFGHQTGDPKDPGFAPDLAKMAEPLPTSNVATDPDDDDGSQGLKGDSISKAELAEMREALAIMSAKAKADEATQAAQAAVAAVKTKIAEAATTILDGLNDTMKAAIVSQVTTVAATVDSVEPLMTTFKDSLMKVVADERLKGMGAGQSNNGGKGTTINNGTMQITDRAPTYMAGVEKLLAASDEYCKFSSHECDPDDPIRKSIRKYNREQLKPIIEKIHEFSSKYKTPQEWNAACDELCSDEENKIAAVLDRASTVFDDTTLSNVYNQPTILTAMIVQMFQDLQSTQFIDVMGPSPSSGPNEGGWLMRGNHEDGRTGAVIRVPLESYQSAAGYGTFIGPQYDASMLFPEGRGIDASTVNVRWAEFPALFRRGAVSITKDVMIEMGSGPLNWQAVGRHFFHLNWDRGRRIDKSNLDEILLISDEYGAVQVTGETTNLTYNSVYSTAGSLTANLNAAKYANAKVASTDPSVTYGTNVIGIVRLQTNVGTSAPSSAGPYCATYNGPTPLLRPRLAPTMANNTGQITNVINHPVSVTVPSNAIEGYVDANGNIQTKPADLDAGNTATFAVDYENGLLLFASGISGSSGLITSTVTVSYYYVTNYDNFIVNNAGSLGLIPSGSTFEQYLEGLLGQHDLTAATMGSTGRYVKPNMAIMSLTASTYITRAATFWQLHSPKNTDLFPTEQFFYNRNGVMGARINAPWYAADRRIHLGRNRSTKYAINSPWEITGPYPAYDSSGRIIPKNIYYGEEHSAIFTPQALDTNGNVVNPVGRSILLR